MRKKTMFTVCGKVGNTEKSHTKQPTHQHTGKEAFSPGARLRLVPAPHGDLLSFSLQLLPHTTHPDTAAQRREGCWDCAFLRPQKCPQLREHPAHPGYMLSAEKLQSQHPEEAKLNPFYLPHSPHPPLFFPLLYSNFYFIWKVYFCFVWNKYLDSVYHWRLIWNHIF